MVPTYKFEYKDIFFRVWLQENQINSLMVLKLKVEKMDKWKWYMEIMICFIIIKVKKQRVKLGKTRKEIDQNSCCGLQKIILTICFDGQYPFNE